jgi:hypothetical protein
VDIGGSQALTSGKTCPTEVRAGTGFVKKGVAITSSSSPTGNCRSFCGPAEFVYRFVYMLCVSLMTILGPTQVHEMICAQCWQNATLQTYILTNTQEDTAYSAAQRVCIHSGTQTVHIDMTGTGKQNITSRSSTATQACLWEHACQPGTPSHCLYILHQRIIRRNTTASRSILMHRVVRLPHMQALFAYCF